MVDDDCNDSDYNDDDDKNDDDDDDNIVPGAPWVWDQSVYLLLCPSDQTAPQRVPI